MSSRVPLGLVAASLAVLLAGCSVHEPPRSYTDAELEVYFEKRLDVAWINTGLDGRFERPVIAGKAVDRVDENSWESFNACVSELGLSSWGSIEKEGGPEFIDGMGGTLIPDVRLEVYRCFAQFPQAENSSGVLLTEAQLDYLYDYYQRWVVPCLETQEYEVEYFPSRTEYKAGYAGWIPYYAVTPKSGLAFDSREFERLIALCGDPFADLDVDGPQWF